MEQLLNNQMFQDDNLLWFVKFKGILTEKLQSMILGS